MCFHSPFLCECHVRVCMHVILTLVTQETSCLGPSDQRDWSHKPRALTHLRTSFSSSQRAASFSQFNTPTFFPFEIQPLGGFTGRWKIMKILYPAQASDSVNYGGLFEQRQMIQSDLTVSHWHPQTCLSLPLNPGVHLSMECTGMLFGSQG